MNKINRIIGTLALLVTLGFMSCEKEVQDVNNENPTVDSREVGTEEDSRSSCFDCPKLIDNGSFEEVNGPVPGGLIHFSQGLVPNWISVSASPTVLDQSGFPNLNYTLPGGYDQDYVCMMGVSASNINPNGYWSEAVANSVQIYGDYDLEYCLEFKHFAVEYEQGINLQPSKIIAYASADIPAYTGPDSQSEFLITDHSYKEVGSVYTSSGKWDQFETNFTSTKDYNQLTFVPYFQDQHPPSGAKAFTHIDDVQLYCQTDALVDIEYAFLPNSISLSPVFDGLPSNVNIDSYVWTITNVTQQVSYQSFDPNPTFNLGYSTTDAFEVCLYITDSRNCCAEFCKLISPPRCSRKVAIHTDDMIFTNDDDGVYNWKRMIYLGLEMCGGGLPMELWGTETPEPDCTEDFTYEDSWSINCDIDISIANECDPSLLLSIGQSNLSAICPGATLTAEDNYNTWILTLPDDTSCGIIGLRATGINREFDADCKNINNLGGFKKVKEPCLCGL